MSAPPLVSLAWVCRLTGFQWLWLGCRVVCATDPLPPSALLPPALPTSPAASAASTNASSRPPERFGSAAEQILGEQR